MVDHVVRFSEQLVLCAKAATVVRDGVRQYNIANAVHSGDSSDVHNKGIIIIFVCDSVQMECYYLNSRII